MENQDALILIASEAIKILLEKVSSLFRTIKERNLIYNISWNSRTTLSIDNNFKTNIFDLINEAVKENYDQFKVNFWNLNFSLKEKLEIIQLIINSLKNSSKNYTIHYLAYVDLPFSFLNGCQLGNLDNKLKIKYYTCDDISNNKKLNNKKSKLEFNEEFDDSSVVKKTTKVSFIYSESYLIKSDEQNEIKDIITNCTIIKITNANFNNRIVTSKKDLDLIWQKIENNLNKLKLDEQEKIEFNFFMACSPQSSFYIGKKFTKKYNRFKNCFFKIFFYDSTNKKYTDYLEIGPKNQNKIISITNKQ